MPDAERLKHLCEFVGRIQLRDVAVLNYLGEGTSRTNTDRVDRAMEPDGQGRSRAQVVIIESRKIAMQHPSIYANLESVRHVGRLTRDNKVGACDQFARAIVEELLL